VAVAQEEEQSSASQKVGGLTPDFPKLTNPKHVDSQTEFDLIPTNDAERLLLRSRSTYYEHDDKASWLLAHQLASPGSLTYEPSDKRFGGHIV